MAAWLVIRPDGYVESACEWDGVVWDPENPALGGWTPPEDRMMVPRPLFTWTVPGVYEDDGDENSGLYTFVASIGAGCWYEGGEDGLGVWKDPINGWTFTNVNGEWVKGDLE